MWWRRRMMGRRGVRVIAISVGQLGAMHEGQLRFLGAQHGAVWRKLFKARVYRSKGPLKYELHASKWPPCRLHAPLPRLRAPQPLPKSLVPSASRRYYPCQISCPMSTVVASYPRPFDRSTLINPVATPRQLQIHSPSNQAQLTSGGGPTGLTILSSNCTLVTSRGCPSPMLMYCSSGGCPT